MGESAYQTNEVYVASSWSDEGSERDVVYRHDPYRPSGRVTLSPSASHSDAEDSGHHNRADSDWWINSSDRAEGKVCACAPTSRRSSLPPSPQQAAAAPVTLHWELIGRVSFVPYPTTEFHAPAPTVAEERKTRLFIGQLPYGVTDMQLDWVFMTFGGAPASFPERITKRDATRGRIKTRTGCLHAYCDSTALDSMILGMHKRILFDDTGVWYAQTPQEIEALAAYCEMMKEHPGRRVPLRPYDTVVVQIATSTYVPTQKQNHPRKHRTTTKPL